MAIMNTACPSRMALAIAAATGTSSDARTFGRVEHAGVGSGDIGAEGVALGRGEQAEDLAVHAEVQCGHDARTPPGWFPTG